MVWRIVELEAPQATRIKTLQIQSLDVANISAPYTKPTEENGHILAEKTNQAERLPTTIPATLLGF